jgi:hypothetical protein
MAFEPVEAEEMGTKLRRVDAPPSQAAGAALNFC